MGVFSSVFRRKHRGRLEARICRELKEAGYALGQNVILISSSPRVLTSKGVIVRQVAPRFEPRVRDLRGYLPGLCGNERLDGRTSLRYGFYTGRR